MVEPSDECSRNDSSITQQSGTEQVKQWNGIGKSECSVKTSSDGISPPIHTKRIHAYEAYSTSGARYMLICHANLALFVLK